MSSASHSTSRALTPVSARASRGSASPFVFRMMSSKNSSGESSIPASRWKREPAPGIIAVDIEVLLPRR
jgi:hypothetical protein